MSLPANRGQPGLVGAEFSKRTRRWGLRREPRRSREGFGRKHEPVPDKRDAAARENRAAALPAKLGFDRTRSQSDLG